eukprot:jgi/Phyca11/533032/estExt2_fgenesh1_pg.C_PHYCAscaffold_100014
MVGSKHKNGIICTFPNCNRAMRTQKFKKHFIRAHLQEGEVYSVEHRRQYEVAREENARIPTMEVMATEPTAVEEAAISSGSVAHEEIQATQFIGLMDQRFQELVSKMSEMIDVQKDLIDTLQINNPNGQAPASAFSQAVEVMMKRRRTDSGPHVDDNSGISSSGNGNADTSSRDHDTSNQQAKMSSDQAVEAFGSVEQTLAAVEEHLAVFKGTSMEDFVSPLSPLERAKVQVSLGVSAKDIRQTHVKQELDRVKAFIKKIKDAEELAKGPKLVLDKDASKRFIHNALSSDQVYVDAVNTKEEQDTKTSKQEASNTKTQGKGKRAASKTSGKKNKRQRKH